MRIFIILVTVFLTSCERSGFSYTNYCHADPRLLVKYEEMIKSIGIEYKVTENDWNLCLSFNDPAAIDSNVLNKLEFDITEYKNSLSETSIVSGDIDFEESLLSEINIPYESAEFHGRRYTYWDRKHDNKVAAEFEKRLTMRKQMGSE